MLLNEKYICSKLHSRRLAADLALVPLLTVGEVLLICPLDIVHGANIGSKQTTTWNTKLDIRETTRRKSLIILYLKGGSLDAKLLRTGFIVFLGGLTHVVCLLFCYALKLPGREIWHRGISSQSR